MQFTVLSKVKMLHWIFNLKYGKWALYNNMSKSPLQKTSQTMLHLWYSNKTWEFNTQMHARSCTHVHIHKHTRTRHENHTDENLASSE